MGIRVWISGGFDGHPICTFAAGFVGCEEGGGLRTVCHSRATAAAKQLSKQVAVATSSTTQASGIMRLLHLTRLLGPRGHGPFVLFWFASPVRAKAQGKCRMNYLSTRCFPQNQLLLSAAHALRCTRLSILLCRAFQGKLDRRTSSG